MGSGGPLCQQELARMSPTSPEYRRTTARLAAACLAVIAFGAALLVAGPSPVAAAPGVYAAWTFEEVVDGDGRHQAYEGTMTVPDLPAATWTTDARADSAVESGASTWLPVGSPFGAVYGSSQAQPYLRLRPMADTPTGPSTTTYTFASPTPGSGWAFALGDVDADQVEVSATDAQGAPVPVAGLGFQSVFNFCDASPRSSTCSSQTMPYDLPSWQPATTSGLLIGNALASDTTGASGWFQPTVPLKTLTFVYTARSGFPVYQTWFAALPGVGTTTSTSTSTTSTSTSSTSTSTSTTSTSTTSTSTTSTSTPTSSTTSTSTTVPASTTTSTVPGSTTTTAPGSTTTAPPLPGGHHPPGPGLHQGGGRRLPATGRALGGLTLVGLGLVGAGLAALRLRPRRA
jgi:cell division septation protein DedD